MNTKYLLEQELAALPVIPAITPTRESLPGLREKIAQLRASSPETLSVTVEEKFIATVKSTRFDVLLYTLSPPVYWEPYCGIKHRAAPVEHFYIRLPNLL